MKERNFATFIEGLNIIAKYAPDGMDTTYPFGAEHDTIYVYIDLSDIPIEDKEELRLLGFRIDYDDRCVVYYT